MPESSPIKDPSKEALVDMLLRALTIAQAQGPVPQKKVQIYVPFIFRESPGWTSRFVQRPDTSKALQAVSNAQKEILPIDPSLHTQFPFLCSWSHYRQPRGRLFEVKGYENISARMATNALHRILRRASLQRHVNWHMFRHTFASHLAMNGTPIPVIQKFMGHASIEMTMRYAHLSPNAHADSVNCFEAMEKAAIQPVFVPPVFRLVESVSNN